MAADISKIIPPGSMTKEERDNVLQHFSCRLASYRNTAQLYAENEHNLQTSTDSHHFDKEIDTWAQGLLENAWIVCKGTEKDCPKLDKYADTSTGRLLKLFQDDRLFKTLNSILFLHITTTKQYSARTRSFLSTFGTLDEESIVSALKNPERAIDQVQRQAEISKEAQAEKGKTLRVVGMGIGAVAGGVLVGVTGGLAAPLVGAGVTAALGWLGVGGTAVGLLASGLAGSSVVCGALFGMYGARSTARMVERHTREIRDLAIVPVREIKSDETLAVRLCVSGWLATPADVTAPWVIYGGDDTYALQWEMQALEELSNALVTLLTSHAMRYVKVEIVKRTVLASLMASLTPIAWLKIGQIIDNPWMNAKALAVKAGAVLGDLLSKRVFGNRPITLTGYSLGSLVIFEAMKYLASLPPAETIHLIQDVYLYGTPTTTDISTWSRIRRVVAGRLVNGYASNDYVLAILSRASDVSWAVAGLQAVDVMGVENILCDKVDGHTMWRGMIGRCLEECGAPGIISQEVELQVTEVASELEKAVKTNPEDAAAPNSTYGSGFG